MVLNTGNNKGDSENVEDIDYNQAQWDVPQLFDPGSTCKGKNAKADVGLFDAGAGPNDQYRIAI